MIIDSALPILFPARPEELPVSVSVIDGDITTIRAKVDSICLQFFKDASGLFAADNLVDLDISFVRHIELQINRVFG